MVTTSRRNEVSSHAGILRGGCRMYAMGSVVVGRYAL
eukprot:COSAG04_NODE_19750_length_409_cov_0.667742_1_plen_36_part_10